MPNKQQTREMGRAKQIRPESNRPEAATAERNHSPESSISSVDVILETQQDPLESQRQQSSEDEATRQQKKRARVSKKGIPELWGISLHICSKLGRRKRSMPTAQNIKFLPQRHI